MDRSKGSTDLLAMAFISLNLEKHDSGPVSNR